MKITINYLKNSGVKTTGFDEPMQYIKTKSYECNEMDEDMQVCTISHQVDRAHLDNIEITGGEQVDALIKFLQNLKPSLRY